MLLDLCLISGQHPEHREAGLVRSPASDTGILGWQTLQGHMGGGALYSPHAFADTETGNTEVGQAPQTCEGQVPLALAQGFAYNTIKG